MTVDELRATLGKLVELLRAADAKVGTVNGLTEFVDATASFGELNLRAFVKLAEAGRSPASPPAPRPRASSAAKSADTDALVEAVRQLYERAADPAVGEDDIRAACGKLSGVSKDGLVTLATTVGVFGMKSKSKPAIISAVTNQLLDRKGAAVRKQLIERPTAADAGVAGAEEVAP